MDYQTKYIKYTHKLVSLGGANTIVQNKFRKLMPQIYNAKPVLQSYQQKPKITKKKLVDVMKCNVNSMKDSKVYPLCSNLTKIADIIGSDSSVNPILDALKKIVENFITMKNNISAIPDKNLAERRSIFYGSIEQVCNDAIEIFRANDDDNSIMELQKEKDSFKIFSTIYLNELSKQNVHELQEIINELTDWVFL
ncbi:hypothetical protein BMW23_0185 [Bodo saltans virus]|uniref:Uncharacterized protein n=1 Tax=Bodo saltans virus TaxID=2024608 RepID=A0A2H4UTH6_9VIRU|nr:hypothetical protein QJ851_gp0180 [Bodo saltans virus]ATZ80243.1 hypothetical protein BMW23_0185 [Bodo saltans virus]